MCHFLRRYAFVFCGLLSVSLVHTAIADCTSLQLRNNFGNTRWKEPDGYDVFDPSQYTESATKRIRYSTTPGTTCEYAITLASGNSGDANQRIMERNGETLIYNVYVDSGRSQIWQDTTSNLSELMTGILPDTNGSNATVTITYYWSIEAQQMVPSYSSTGARYRDNDLEMTIYEIPSSGPYIQHNSRDQDFRTRVIPQIELSVLPDSGGFDENITSQTLNFENLDPAEVMTADVRIRSNDGYTLEYRSDNNQTMIHEDAPTVTTIVPYNVDVNGGNVDLSSGNDVTIATLPADTVTTLSGDEMDTTIEIGSFSNVDSGNYSDTINITVSSN